jgi:protein-L-isoaspartate(D-aspartate) O-methyltransferase
MTSDSDYEHQRERMVREQIEGRGLDDKRLLEAMRSVPRHEFVPEGSRGRAYRDGPLPIGEGQTISQPYIVALMTDELALEPTDKVLEIGTGSGYGAAVLAAMAGKVYTVERHADLADDAEDRFERLGYNNIEVVIGDGTRGLPSEAPFDGIVATAAGPEVPESLADQLADGGRLVMPVGTKHGGQRLVRVTRTASGVDEHDLGMVRFVPLIGEEGWSGGSADGPSSTTSGRSVEP